MTHFDHNALCSAVLVKVLFQLNIWLVNFLLARYSDEYPAGWCLVTHSLTELLSEPAYKKPQADFLSLAPFCIKKVGRLIYGRFHIFFYEYTHKQTK